MNSEQLTAHYIQLPIFKMNLLFSSCFIANIIYHLSVGSINARIVNSDNNNSIYSGKNNNE